METETKTISATEISSGIDSIAPATIKISEISEPVAVNILNVNC